MFTAVSNGIVALHKGSLSVYSKGEGFGSTFTLLLPLTLTDDAIAYASGDVENVQMLEKMNQSKLKSKTLKEYSNPDSAVNEIECSRIVETYQNKNHVSDHITYSNILRGDISMSLDDDPRGGGSSHSKIGNDVLKDSKDEYKVSSERTVRDTHYTRVRSFLFAEGSKPVVVRSEMDTVRMSSRMTTRWSTTAALHSSSISDEKPYVFVEESDKVERVRTFRFLVVDDSAINRKMMVRVLNKRDCIIDEAENGQEAIDYVKSSICMNLLYDAVFMDFVMPIMDGPKATKIIRGLGYKGKILGVTGNALLDDINIFLAHGADKVLTKPFNLNAFEASLEGQ